MMINFNTFTLVLIMIFICAIGALGAIHLKRGAQKIKLNKRLLDNIKIIKNKNFIFGIFLYAIALIITIYLLSLADLSLIYPLTSITYIFTIILSHYMLDEKITKYKWLAVLLIVSGNVLITLG